jgi:CBS domain-containing protein
LTVLTKDTIDVVEDMLSRHDLSAVPVTDAKGAVFGIISSMDIMHLHATHKNPKTVRAWELCTYKPIQVVSTTPARDVARVMVEKKIHHVLVIDNGKLAGIVSSLDFVEQFVIKDKTP